ncbi:MULTISPECIES: DUF3037 domain-containing protein [unclassified Variovorax]|uniref:DUF3037 domain-containing protein n=1 Tax=unclassified Variovorax TaxID=663243 RepID=UPI000838158F|nr:MULTISPECIES: DUF3037 domain-containing protein [unclassified Variovorax]PNG58508.1 hypothetical protein CHC07_00233 [Variovorax sp. B4]PNG61702.1 hypothetical protein CHC06_01603 [Variovorax sp. B2]VTV12247.1 hypothetical protein WDL1CHR_03062 [Variovorax sp. WDL1]
MFKEGSYTYAVLRYVHDIGTAEFINVGVVVAACEAPRVAARFKTDYGRVKSAFPSLDTEVFLGRMKRLQGCFDSIDASRCLKVRAREGASIAALIRSVLPLEDSAIHWSPIGSGVGGPPEEVLESLYRRMVTKHELRRRH